jgi:NAD(P) transhydrogenase subunit beta
VSPWIQLAYLVSTALFILALKWMNKPETARRGVLSGVTAMLLAVVSTLAMPGITHLGDITVAVLVGTAIGVPVNCRN